MQRADEIMERLGFRLRELIHRPRARCKAQGLALKCFISMHAMSGKNEQLLIRNLQGHTQLMEHARLGNVPRGFEVHQFAQVKAKP
ncbi:MAG: hypothetical protein A3F92_09470 [Candidatus Rokubacteria bacterium RIFCSPLOWO2_12_FULL_71_22]|nr:MAG: hypothetical protein A3F92_09470 [Candidatus Rokubacteria bacterium RIFCSPLOWO2_12_FULL_71_22]